MVRSSWLAVLMARVRGRSLLFRAGGACRADWVLSRGHTSTWSRLSTGYVSSPTAKIRETEPGRTGTDSNGEWTSQGRVAWTSQAVLRNRTPSSVWNGRAAAVSAARADSTTAASARSK